MLKIKYDTEEEKQSILDEQTTLGLILIEEQNLVDGNFLIFDTKPYEKPKTEIELLKEQLQGQQAIIDELLFEVIPSLLPIEEEMI